MITNDYMMLQPYGSYLPGVPQPGMFAPTRSEAAYAGMQQQFAIQMQRAIMQNDSRVLAMLGNSGTQNNLLAREAAGNFLNNQSLNPYWQGNSINLANGLATMISGSSVQARMITGSSIGNEETILGRGAATDQIALEAFRNFQKDFTDANGLLYRSKTHGLDRTELGDMMSYIGRSGAMAGMIEGYTANRDGTWTEARKKAVERGQTGLVSAIDDAMEREIKDPRMAQSMAFAFTEESRDKINKFIEGSAKAIRSLKNVFGSRSMQELLQTAEQLAGGTLTAEKLARVAGRIESAQNFSAANGLNPEAFLQQEMQMVNVFKQMGVSHAAATEFGRSASRSANLLFRDHNIARNQARENGVWLPEVSLEEFKAREATSLTQLTREQAMAAVLPYAIQRGALSESQREEFYQKYRDINFNKDGSPRLYGYGAEGIAAKRAEYNKLFSEVSISSGTTMEDIFRLTGTNNLTDAAAVAQTRIDDEDSPAGGLFGRGIIAENVRRSRENVAENLARSNGGFDAMIANGMDRGNAKDIVNAALYTVNRQTLGKIIQAARNGKDIGAVIDEANISDDDKLSVKAVMEFGLQTGGAEQFANTLDSIRKTADQLDVMDTGSTEAIRNNAIAEIRAGAARTRFGTDVQPGVFEDLIRGFTGKGEVSNNEVFAFAYEKSKQKGGEFSDMLISAGTFSSTSNTISMDRDTASNLLSKVPKEILSRMGILNETDLQDALADPVRLNEFRENMFSSGYSMGQAQHTNTDRRDTFFLKNEEMDVAKRSIIAGKRVVALVNVYGSKHYGNKRIQKLLDGTSVEGIDYTNTEELDKYGDILAGENGYADKAVFRRNSRLVGEKLSEFNWLDWDSQDEEQARMTDLFRVDPEAALRILDSAASQYDEGSNRRKKITEFRESLQSSSSTADKFMGVLSLVDEAGASLKLYRQ